MVDDGGDMGGRMGDDGRTKTRNERKHHRNFLDFRQNDKLLRYYYYLQQRC